MTAYDQDYYVQGKQNYRLSRVFQPWLTLCQNLSLDFNLALCYYSGTVFDPARYLAKTTGDGAGLRQTEEW